MRAPRVQFLAPPGSCDTHIHFYGAASRIDDSPFPVRSAAPAHYRDVMRRLGLDRFVAVQSILYGDDNSVMLAAIREFGGTARGVAVLKPTDISDTVITSLHAQGVRGVRAYMIGESYYSWPQLPAICEAIAPYGWHLQLQFEGALLPSMADVISRYRSRVVIDHIGKLGPLESEAVAGVVALKRLLDAGSVWLKLCAPYHSSYDHTEDYRDVGRNAKELAAHAPERMLWGSNWPHSGYSPPPDEAHLLALLGDWIPDSRCRALALSGNAAELYGFTGDR
jgi:D-galactarolactone isomerase